MRIWMIACCACACSSLATAGEWPHWRGPNRNDIVAEHSGWQDGRWHISDVQWKVNVGEGGTSPLVAGEKLFVLGWQNGRNTLHCLTAKTGEKIWTQAYQTPRYGRRSTGDKGIYSGPSATPEYDAATGYLYTLSLDGDLHCWDTQQDGQKVWSLNLYDKYGVGRRPEVAKNKRTRRDYGYTTAPLVYHDWLIVEVGSTERGNLIAFDKRTGKPLWSSQNKDEAGHTGGLVPLTVEKVPCVAVLTLRNLVVTRLDEGQIGKTVAAFPWTTDFGNNIPTPAVHENEVIITSAYNHFAMCKVRVSLNGANKVWENKYPSGVCSPVIYDGHVYWVWRTVHCVDLATGELKWRGGSFSTDGSCLITSDGRLLMWTRRGSLMLAETAKRSPAAYAELTRQEKLAQSDVWPHVVLADGRIYCKDRDGNLFCFAVKQPAR